MNSQGRHFETHRRDVVATSQAVASRLEGQALVGSLFAISWALVMDFVVYGILAKVVGLRLAEEEEFKGADLVIHSIGAYPEDHVR